MNRRDWMKGAAAMTAWGAWGDRGPRIPGGNPPMRPDQAMQLGRSSAGSGPAPTSPFIVARRVIITGPNGALFVYSGTPALGNLIASITATAGTDQFGNVTAAGITSYVPGNALVNLASGSLGFGSHLAATRIANTGAAGGGISLVEQLSDSAQQALAFISPRTQPLVGTGTAVLWMLGESKDASKPAMVLVSPQTATPAPVTGASLEVQTTLAAARLDVAPAATAPPARPSGTEPWNAATFANSWANAAGRTPLTFRFVAAPSACVQIRGGVTAPVGIAAGQTMFTLPAAYAPADLNSIIAVNVTTGAIVRFAATVGGAVNFQSGAVAGDVIDIPANSLVSLDA